MSSPTIHEHVLPNGLVLLGQTMKSVQSAAFTFLLPAGAAYDQEDRQGTASLLGEWQMRGAGELDSEALLTALDRLGVSHGEGAQTAHMSVSAACLGRNLQPALELYAQVIRQPHLDPDELEPLQALALQSLQSLEDDPGSKAIAELRRRHFPAPWGRLALGTASGIESMTVDDVRAFHQRHAQPQGAILAVAGAIDWPAVRDAVERLFGDWSAVPSAPIISTPSGPRRDHIAKDTQQTQIALAFHTVPLQDPSYYLARAAIGVLGGYSSARLFTEVREKRGLCYSVHAGYEALQHHAAVICYAGTTPERAQETLDVTLAEIHRLAADGIEDEELQTMRAGLKSSLIMQQESTTSRSGALAADWYYLGRIRPLDEIAAAFDALTAQSVSAFAASQELDDLTILTLGPRPLELPL